MIKNCDNCINSGRPSYEWPCTDCITAHDSAPSKWESMFSTVGFAEVVRCVNCQSHEPCEVRNRVWCIKMGRYMKEDGFCSEGDQIPDG